MTIDEAIAHAREVAKNKREHIVECNKKNNYACKFCVEIRTCKEVAEEHEQLAEWLEELVMLRLDSCMIHMPERLRLVENGYNKAIDDFVKAIVDRGLSANDDKYCITHYDNYLKVIKEIAEQLKEQK